MPNFTAADFTAVYPLFAAESGRLLGQAKKYKNDAITIKNGTNACSPSFHLLSSLAFELFPKVLIGYEIYLKHKDKKSGEITPEEIRTEINQSMRQFNHDLAKLYNHFPDLLKILDIKSIKTFQNPYIWEYRVILNGSDYEIGLKDIEAVRYGPFANNMDILTDCQGDYLIIDLLNKLEDYISRKNVETNIELKKYFVKD